MWSRLQRWQDNSQNKVSLETYLKICEQTGEEIDENKIPPEFTDFPLDVQNAIVTYGKLGDRIVADIGYLGKDLTSLDIHMRVCKTENEDIFLETILRLDEIVIRKSAEEMKRERERMKRK